MCTDKLEINLKSILYFYPLSPEWRYEFPLSETQQTFASLHWFEVYFEFKFKLNKQIPYSYPIYCFFQIKSQERVSFMDQQPICYVHKLYVHVEAHQTLLVFTFQALFQTSKITFHKFCILFHIFLLQTNPRAAFDVMSFWLNVDDK